MSMEYKSKLPHTPVTLQDKVAQMYYRHGVFCASHPYIIMIITLVILAFCCYPVLYLPLLGSSSQQFTTPVQEHMSQRSSRESDSIPDRAPWWFQGPPVGFVQQIVIKSVVMPWKSGLILTDAFRGPLAEGFSILETIRNHRTAGDNATTLGDICLQVSEPVDKRCQSLPQYGCLILSPAHMWTQDTNKFQQDPDIIKTIFQFRDIIPDSCNLRDVLFGVPWKETGIKKLNMRTRPRILTYAITIIMKELDLEFIHSLHKKLQEKYSFLPYPENITYNPKDSNIVHVQFQDQYTVAEFVPLGVTYVILFLYIYFSVRKIEMVKSKWALAVSAVITLLMSLFMSVGLCLWFGLHPTLNGSEILPYLVVVIGLENVLVLTKSVVSTPDHLDTKLRLAQGLSKEGWSITKNLFTELALLTFAFFTFVPAIQEFCLFAVVGLLSDFFLQLVFFITALSIGIGRTELADSYSVQQRIKLMNAKYQQPMNSKPFPHKMDSSNSSLLYKTKFGSTHLKSPFVLNQKPYSADNRYETTRILGKVPKRLKFVYFWANTRIVQRGLMVSLVFWILVLVYKSGIVSHLADNTTRLGPTLTEQVVLPLFSTLTGGSNKSDNGEEDEKDNSGDWQTSTVKFRLQHHNVNNWKALPSHHWATLFGYYNISLSGSYISILPTIHLCIPIDPDVALKLRHPADVDFEKMQTMDKISDTSKFDDSSVLDIPYHPSSPAEVALAFALSVPSFIFFIYLMVLLYRCMCSRHYAEWRSSWHQKVGNNSKEEYSYAESDHYFVSETFPIKLQGHTYEVENFVAEENVVVSACLAGDICIWDALSGECLRLIKRSKRSSKLESPSIASGDGNSSSTSNDNVGTTTQCEENCKSLNTYCNLGNKDISFSYPSYMHSDLKTEHSQGYDFSKFCKCTQSRQKQSPEVEEKPVTLISDDKSKLLHHQSSLYNGNSPDLESRKDASVQYSSLPYQSIWCMDCNGNRLVLGCAEGRIEVWDTTTGVLKCRYEDNDSGVTSICLSDNRITAARLNGVLEFFLLNYSGYCTNDSNKKRNGIIPCIDSSDSPCWECLWLHTVHAHSQPITKLVTGGGHVITGSQDHLVKIFRSESPVCLYTLHGHSGGVTALHIDQSTSSSAASGCQDGMICVWDLMTGTCVYSLRAHRGAIMALLTSSMYVISYGADDFMCIWEKCQGHHLHTIHQPHSICNDVVLLTNNIIVTAKEDHLTLWDVNHGETLQMISLGSNEQGAFVKGLKLAGRALVCDYGSQLFIIHFPAIREKGE